jgi:hypothetical protein
MFGLEKIADLFDELHEENQRFIEESFSRWTTSVYEEEGEGGWLYAAVTTAATAEALYKVAGGLGAGLVDTLRIGEGVGSGTAWGVAQDGLRAISVVGGVFRIARLASAEMKLGGTMTCTIASSSKAAVISGNKPSLSLFFTQAAKLFGGRDHVVSSAFRGTATAVEYEELFRALGMRVTKVAVASADDIAEVARTSRGPVVFGAWNAGGGGHAMVAYRGLLGEIRYADQFGRTATSLTRMGSFSSIIPEAMIVHEAGIVQALRWGAVGQFLTVPVVALPSRGMARLEDEVRKATGRERPGEKKQKKQGGAGKPPLAWRHPALGDDAYRVLAKLPPAPETIETERLMAETAMSLSRVVNAISSLSQAGLVTVAAWSMKGGATLPARVQRSP